MEILNVPKKKPSPDDIGQPGHESRTQAYLDQVGALIRDNGWAIQAVSATADSRAVADYVYTIGLVERGCTAELMIAGLPHHKGAEILSQIAASMLNNTQWIPPAEWPLGGGFTLRSRTFCPRVGGELHVGVARAFYRREVVFTQYVWPNAERKYPGEEGWDPDMLQPVGGDQ